MIHYNNHAFRDSLIEHLKSSLSKQIGLCEKLMSLAARRQLLKLMGKGQASGLACNIFRALEIPANQRTENFNYVS